MPTRIRNSPVSYSKKWHLVASMVIPADQQENDQVVLQESQSFITRTLGNSIHSKLSDQLRNMIVEAAHTCHFKNLHSGVPISVAVRLYVQVGFVKPIDDLESQEFEANPSILDHLKDAGDGVRIPAVGCTGIFKLERYVPANVSSPVSEYYLAELFLYREGK